MKSFSSSRFQSYGFFFAVLLNLQITRTVGGFAPTNEKCSKAIEITEGGDLENQRLSQEYTEAYYKIYLGKPMALKVYGFSSSVTSDYLSMSMRPSVSSDSTGTCDDSAGVPFVKKSEYVESSFLDSVNKRIVSSRARAIRRYRPRVKKHLNDLDLPTSTRIFDDVMACFTMKKLHFSIGVRIATDKLGDPRGWATPN